MKKVLTTLLLLVSLAGIGFAADDSATGRQTSAQLTSVTGGQVHSLLLQRGRWRRRNMRRIRWNRGRMDNNGNRGRWNRRRWNRNDDDNNNWRRRRRNRGDRSHN